MRGWNFLAWLELMSFNSMILRQARRSVAFYALKSQGFVGFCAWGLVGYCSLTLGEIQGLIEFQALILESRQYQGIFLWSWSWG